MNKISKKILAIVTMAAFVVTMMPFAAFAAEPADVQTSEFHAIDRNGDVLDEVPVDAGDAVTAQFYVNDKTGVGTTEPLGSSNVKVWAVDNSTNQVTSAATFAAVDENQTVTNKGNVWYFSKGEVKNDTKVTVTFSRAGEYTLYAGVGDIDDNGGVSKIQKLKGASVVTVEGTTATVDYVTINEVDGVDVPHYTDGDVVPEITADLIANGIDTDSIVGYAYDENKKAVRNATFTLDTNKSGIDLEETTVTTDNVGKFEITYSMTKADTYRIYVDGDISLTLQVKKDAATKIDTITNTTENAKTLLAGSDTKNFDEQDEVSLADAVQFTIAYDNGTVLDDVDLTTLNPAEPAADVDNLDHSKYLSIEQKPEKSKLTAGDLKLAWSSAKEAYTLVYVGNTDADKDLLAGEYTVKVALTSGKSAEATFTLAEFGEVEDLSVKVQAKDYETPQDKYADIDDEIVYGQDMKVIPMYVDENGIEIPANKAEVGVVGQVTPYTDQSLKNQFRVTTDKDYIGSVITVRVFDQEAKKFVEKELTIVDQYDAYTLAFDSEQGEANKTNKVEVSVVDEDGTVIKNVNGADVMAYVADQSNADAKVEVTADENTTNGKADIKIFSNEETTVDVVVAVKTVDNQIYGATLNYTIGAEDVNADTSVVMTIGSSDIVVNNNVVDAKAAPYVDSNWRTMVPLRALTESFGGTADWDGDARTVTVVNGDTTIVFNADSNKYTVNDVEKEMDTELSIIDGRTYVPVKFVAEELGYTVTALKDAAGLTASVVIQK